MGYYRLSPSKIEQFRKFYKSEMSGFITEEKVIESIMGSKHKSPQIDFGTAYHAIIENGCDKYLSENGDYYIFEGDMQYPQTFSKNEIIPALEYASEINGAVHECWNEYHVHWKGKHIVVPMRLDVMYGLQVHEVKTTSIPVDIESYMNSCQWRYYLCSTGSSKVRYQIFRYWNSKNGEDRRIEPISFECYPDEDIELKMKQLAYLTLEFCLDNNLESKIYYG